MPFEIRRNNVMQWRLFAKQFTLAFVPNCQAHLLCSTASASTVFNAPTCRALNTVNQVHMAAPEFDDAHIRVTNISLREKMLTWRPMGNVIVG